MGNYPEVIISFLVFMDISYQYVFVLEDADV